MKKEKNTHIRERRKLIYGEEKVEETDSYTGKKQKKKWKKTDLQ